MSLAPRITSSTGKAIKKQPSTKRVALGCNTLSVYKMKPKDIISIAKANKLSIVNCGKPTMPITCAKTISKEKEKVVVK